MFAPRVLVTASHGMPTSVHLLSAHTSSESYSGSSRKMDGPWTTAMYSSPLLSTLRRLCPGTSQQLQAFSCFVSHTQICVPRSSPESSASEVGLATR